jgi:hypothetical protein
MGEKSFIPSYECSFEITDCASRRDGEKKYWGLFEFATNHDTKPQQLKIINDTSSYSNKFKLSIQSFWPSTNANKPNRANNMKPHINSKAPSRATHTHTGMALNLQVQRSIPGQTQIIQNSVGISRKTRKMAS